MSQEIRIVATNSDYHFIIPEFEEHFDVKYLLQEFKPDTNPTIYSSALETKSLGCSLRGCNISDERFDIFEKSVEIITIPRPQQKGGTLYLFGGNGPVLDARFGGKYKNECLVLGSVTFTGDGTNEYDTLSLTMFRYISRLIRKKFCRVGYMWLGPEAFELYKSGMPVKYDQRNEPILPAYEIMEEHLDPKHLENLRKLNGAHCKKV